MNDLIIGLIAGLIGGVLIGLVIGIRFGLPIGLLKRGKWRAKKIPGTGRANLRPSHLLQSSSHGHSLLVPLRSDMAYPEQAIRSGLELALHSGQTLNFIVFLEVPRTHNLESGLDEELEEAFQLLEKAEQQAHQAGIAIRTSATKVRSYFWGVADSALELKAGLIILEQFSHPHGVNRSGLDTQASQLASKTGCNILLLTRPAFQAEVLLDHP